ncbi:hypothetical protein MJH12_03070, partial [bacterium]|nr:hypothetical protein [bacterium]
NIKILLLVVAMTTLSIVIAFYYIKPRLHSDILQEFPKIMDSGFKFVFAFLPMVLFLLIEDLNLFFNFGMIIFFHMNLFILHLIFTYDCGTKRAQSSLLFLISYSVSIFLYSTRLAITGDVFFFSLIWGCILFFRQHPSFNVKLFTSVIFIVSSNFFPNLSYLPSNWGDFSSGFYLYYVDGFHQNPLGWKASDTIQEREMIISSLSERNFDSYGGTNFSAFIFMHPFQALVLEVLGEEELQNPHMKTLLQSMEDDPKLLFMDYKARGDALFETWLDKEMILYFTESNQVASNYKRSCSTKPSCLEFIESVSFEEYRSNVPLRREISRALQNSYFLWLQKESLLAKYYQKTPLINSNLYILKSVPKRSATEKYLPYSKLVGHLDQENERSHELEEKGDQYFSEVVSKLKLRMNKDCRKSLILCQALLESAEYFSKEDDNELENRLRNLKQYENLYISDKGFSDQEFNSFKELFLQILPDDLDLADTMLSIATKKFSSNYSFTELEERLEAKSIQQSIQFESEALLLQANHFLDLFPPNFKKAKELLEKALILTPKSEEIQRDYEVVLTNLKKK